MKSKSTRWRRWLLGSVLAVILLGAGYYGLRHVAWPAIKTARVERMNREARAFLVAGDPANALLVARKSLKSSTRNPAAWRIAAEASLARERPDTLWYQDNLCREEPTRENRLELIRLALHFGVPGYATGTLRTLAETAREDPVFHRLAAQVCARTGQAVAARYHLEELTRLEPSDQTAQLDLAEVALAADPERLDPGLRPRVLALADEPALRVRALALLLRENLAARLLPGTAELVSRLQAERASEMPVRLLVLEGLFLLQRPEAAAMLAALQVEVAAQPADAARVIHFLTRTGRAAAVQPWVASLPAASRGVESVQHGVAEALLVLGDAPGLEAHLRGLRWPERDYLREALLAYAYRAQGRSADFSAAWRLALVGTGSDLRKTATLLARVDGWRWVNERHDVIWRIFALNPANESVQHALILWERHQGNTANLHRLFARIVEVTPADEVARNNFAYTGLLLDANVGRAGLIAAELVAAKPDNPYYRTTHALALYKQGHPAEALARLDALTFSERAEPVRQLFRALCLVALGRAAPAADLMQGLVRTEMLPEEKRLAEGVIAEIARLDRASGNRIRLLASGSGAGAEHRAAGWLALVAPATRQAASTDMQLADSLLAAPDWAGLGELLRATNWPEANHLRAALQARVAREAGDILESQSQWRQALALADRNLGRLQDLRALATGWAWTTERLETLNLIFERDAGDLRLLAELLEHYRAARRTTEMRRVLGLHLAGATDPSDAAVAHAYYSLLLDTNLAQAHVAARRAFEAAPADDGRRMVYVFSLWKQQRAAEARPLLAAVKPAAVSALVPIPLLRATIQAQLGDTAGARASLGEFDPAIALPEESALADRLARQLALDVADLKSPGS